VRALNPWAHRAFGNVSYLCSAKQSSFALFSVSILDHWFAFKFWKQSQTRGWQEGGWGGRKGHQDFWLFFFSTLFLSLWADMYVFLFCTSFTIFSSALILGLIFCHLHNFSSFYSPSCSQSKSIPFRQNYFPPPLLLLVPKQFLFIVRWTQLYTSLVSFVLVPKCHIWYPHLPPCENPFLQCTCLFTCNCLLLVTESSK